MPIFITTESRLTRTPDGKYWTPSPVHYAFWQRYLAVFDDVVIVARVKDQETVPENYHRVDGDRVSVRAVPYYIGPAQYLRAYPALRRAFGEIAE